MSYFSDLEGGSGHLSLECFTKTYHSELRLVFWCKTLDLTVKGIINPTVYHTIRVKAQLPRKLGRK